MRAWLRDKIPTIRLPDLLLTVDQGLDWTRHFLPVGQRATRTADDVCQVVATIMAYGCNLGPETMARLTTDVTYADIQQIKLNSNRAASARTRSIWAQQRSVTSRRRFSS